MESHKLRDLLFSVPRSYEYMQGLLFVKTKHVHLRKAIAGLSLPTPCRVLDLGCGTGQAATLFSDAARYRYLGTDISEAYVGRARKRFPNLDFQVIDTRKEDLSRGDFDLVLIDSVLHHISDEDAALFLAKAAASIKPGGLCLIQDMFFPPREEPLSRLGNKLIALDRGEHCRRYDGLTDLAGKHFELQGVDRYPLKVMGIPLYRMALMICRRA